MKYRIRRIGVFKAALVAGIAYAAMGLLFVPFALLVFLAAPPMGDEFGNAGEWLIGPAMMLLAPIMYGIIGFISAAIATAVYNLIATMMGGLEIELDPVAGTSTGVA
jgi:hypothetical protein